MKTKNLKTITVVLLFCILNSFVSCTSDDEGNIVDPISGQELNIINVIMSLQSLGSRGVDGLTGTLIYRDDQSYTYNFDDGFVFDGNWEWINEGEYVMKVDQFTDFDGTVYTTYNKFVGNEDGSILQYRIQTTEDTAPDANSPDWIEDLLLTVN